MAYTNLPPNLYDYFSIINQRIRKLESAPDQAMTIAVSAQSIASDASAQAIAAEAQAATALANAAIAYTAAENSLQPSAYAIQDPTTKQLTSINATGLTVYTGSSPTSGARVVLNSVGLAGYDSSGNATFTITASTGAAVFSGRITGSDIVGSTLNIGGNFYVDGATGFLTCTGATITGTITATSGSFTGSIYASSGTIGGWTITGSQLQGFGGTYLDSSAGTIFTDGLISTLGNISANGTITGTTGLAGGTLAIAGAANMNGLLYNLGHATTTNAANVYMNPSSSLIALVTSSERYKVEILSETIPLESVMSLVPKSWIDKAEFEANENSSNGLKRILGVIAEDVAQIPVLKDLLVNYNEQGQPDSINYDRIAITLIPLLQDLQNRVTKLEGANGTTTSN